MTKAFLGDLKLKLHPAIQLVKKLFMPSPIVTFLTRRRVKKFYVSLRQDLLAWLMLFAIGQQLQNVVSLPFLDNYLEHVTQKMKNY